MTIRFDESLKVLVVSAKEVLEGTVLENCVVLRDSTGRLSLLLRQEIDGEAFARADAHLLNSLDAYARDDRVLAFTGMAGIDRILQEADENGYLVAIDGITFRFLDRRIVGIDWTHRPIELRAPPVRVVFASLKGGVGRSTALTVFAAEQARKGKNVLAIDLDLEAPGIGAILLDDSRRPKYGMLDILVENGLGGVEPSQFQDFIGTSSLTAGVGLVDVVPACGTATQLSPENYLPKLARAMTEDVGPDGTISVREQVLQAVDALASFKAYDYILIDSRAGMAELAAGPVLGLGAVILLFGTPQQQTFEGFRYLFAALSQLTSIPKQDLSWRERIKVVMAKGDPRNDSVEAFISETYDLFTSYLYDEVDGIEGFSFDANDSDAPHFPLLIPFDQRFSDWEPVRRQSDLNEQFYASTFGPFVMNLQHLLDLLVEVRSS